MTRISLEQRSYRREVEALLQQIQLRRRELRRLKARGARGLGPTEPARALAAARARLAELVGTENEPRAA